ncbi:MAG: methylenetetrahydrofolate--tRNA-(uracil(54)-C(5))-methyltransferase (FADH(2)-oxidizing) TrmFO [Synergistaceae bacterium]|jgi:methylenetetrahydrofolate--tRNA-(uracil-5-)-methyltransferase|nr:methylenetetrahydrofolate--tRNA-(uracil(54)-C(5))-methyltransferase (FADH(2)-oxidizing) TrmFO [Synergistaceae bacterium]NLW61893.1 methylenetetrahydrofolate--tRNA-(uracil(54)-C(5))-methyltransferase (FADH(2)-oxidizing) TrmFO [Synergistaceae bacterium]
MQRQTCKKITITGGGLSGSEAAWQLAQRGFSVRLHEMRPQKKTPAHETAFLGELVCSNSFGGEKPTTSAGILKSELSLLGSLIMECAQKSRVPAGNALAVDREVFSRLVDSAVLSHPNIEVIREEMTELPEGPSIIATGPLTSDEFAESLKKLVGKDFLYFYDAVAPIVTLESVDPNYSFRGNRYGESGDYINCPMDEDAYRAFWEALVNAETAQKHSFENEEMRHFEGCLPVEVIAKRGEKTLLFGPLRPVGFTDEKSGREYCAVVQLRQDNEEGTLYNMVGFQTNLKWGEQERVFRMIPALRNAEFVRKGVMHRNLFVCAPTVLDGYLRPAGKEDIFLAGQITGVEGYLESTAMGLASALFMTAQLKDLPMPDFPLETAIGSLLNYLRTAIPKTFQPMNVNLGIFPKLDGKKIKKRTERCEAYHERAMAAMSKFIAEQGELFTVDK